MNLLAFFFLLQITKLNEFTKNPTNFVFWPKICWLLIKKQQQQHYMALIMHINFLTISWFILLFLGWGKWEYDHSYPRLLTAQRSAKRMYPVEIYFLWYILRDTQPTVWTKLTTVFCMTVWFPFISWLTSEVLLQNVGQ